ncbi:aldo/keto reductase [Saccharopolyspora sp. K220]|uniref:aldo/keto reductase n=1 Tax=Saccharopolyspora soli TaxID=2926618 RepID=UPI001F56D179|nr:aldo/keto reductase [Saccharopolyspora soli]MCI2418397.1 aldo/keto reductase [Saccharopolyspora soli]
MTTQQYRLLGRTGLRVSPIALGALTFGGEGWHADEDTARSIFRHYVAAGGNFVDTSINYAGGRSEELLGTFMKETGLRDRLVVATKFAVATRPGDPNSGGNGRKNIVASLDTSLRRLRTDYVDLYWLHMWDAMTPVEEVMSTLDALIRNGKVRAIGLSNVPAWYAAKAQMIARSCHWEPVAALQMEYSLAERAIEREHVPAARDLGIGIVPWSPLANGLLAGKYTQGRQGEVQGEGRLSRMMADGTLDALNATGNPAVSKLLTERNFAIVAVLRECARELGRTPAQVALNWIARRPGVVSTLISVTRSAQLEDNLRALDFEIPEELAERLQEVSRPEPVYPYYFSGPTMGSLISAGTATTAG